MALHHLTKDEIKAALKKQKDDAGWTFFNEREFMENLLQTRFNFLLTVYALFFTAFFLTPCGAVSKFIILIIGLIITILVWIVIYRIYEKVDALLRILYALDPQFTSTMVKRELGKCDKFPDGVNKFIAVYIPLILVITHGLGIIYYFIELVTSCSNGCCCYFCGEVLCF